MRISTLARKAGMRPSAIRYYESAGLLPAPSRRGGQRDYTPDAELYLAVIAVARRAGFSVREVKAFVSGFRDGTPASVRWRRLARRKHEEIDLQITRLRAMQTLLQHSVECRCLRVEDCGRILVSQRSTITTR